MTYLFHGIVILDGEQAACQKDLQLLYDGVSGFEDGYQRCHEVVRFARTKF